MAFQYTHTHTQKGTGYRLERIIYTDGHFVILAHFLYIHSAV